MILRFMGRMPEGRFEFTCVCGKWNCVDIRPAPRNAPQEYDCEGCKKTFRVWQQTTHWHVSVD